MNKIVKRSDKVAFYAVNSEDDAKFHRMKGFTEISLSKNPKEYSRQYIDEEFERTDVVGYSTSLSYGFDQHEGDAVHDDLVKIHDGELLASDAVRSIVIVDFTKSAEGEDGKFFARKRDFSVIPDGEGSSTDAYTYTGTFKTAGDTVSGRASSNDGWQTCVFVADDE